MGAGFLFVALSVLGKKSKKKRYPAGGFVPVQNNPKPYRVPGGEFIPIAQDAPIIVRDAPANVPALPDVEPATVRQPDETSRFAKGDVLVSFPRRGIKVRVLPSTADGGSILYELKEAKPFILGVSTGKARKINGILFEELAVKAADAEAAADLYLSLKKETELKPLSAEHIKRQALSPGGLKLYTDTNNVMAAALNFSKAVTNYGIRYKTNLYMIIP